jgi:hypothetical protein
MTASAKSGGELFIVDNSDTEWKCLRYLQDWTEIATAFDIITGFFEISSQLALDGKWQKLEEVRIPMGDQATARTRQATHFLDNEDVGGVIFNAEFTEHSPRYPLALLNSSLLCWFFPQASASFSGGFRFANKQFLSLLPIQPINFAGAGDRAEHDAVVVLVDRILKAERADAAADRAALERDIDERVGRLYSLTADEIKLVGAFRQ